MTRSPENTHGLLFWHLSYLMKPTKIQTETKLHFTKGKQIVLQGFILIVYTSYIFLKQHNSTHVTNTIYAHLVAYCVSHI